MGKRSVSSMCFGICPMNSLAPAIVDDTVDEGDADFDDDIISCSSSSFRLTREPV